MRKFKADELVEAVATFAQESGTVVKVGDRYRGGDDLPRKLPNLFMPVASTSAEIAEARMEASWREVPADDGYGHLIPHPIPPERRLRVTRNFHTYLDGADLWVLKAGDVVDAEDERVIRLRRVEPDLFKKAASGVGHEALKPA